MFAAKERHKASQQGCSETVKSDELA